MEGYTPGPTNPELSSALAPPRLLEDRHNNNTRLLSPDLKAAAAMTSDIEQFQGKIVYNPDGSAYIIEDGDYSDEESLDLPRQEGSIVEKPGEESEADQFPTIENAVYVSRSRSQYPSYVRAQTQADRPTVHSYRVYNYRHKPSDKQGAELLSSGSSPDNVPVKPILMCFICKLSFGNTKSFKNHCMDEHSLDFNDDEVDILKIENISALVQPVGKDKSPLLSFLEPVVKGHYSLPSDQVPSLHSPSKSPGEGGIRVRNDLAASQISPASNGRSSVSPGVASMSPSPNSFSPMGSYSLKGTTIGACSDHAQGRPAGVECAKCDLILNSNRMGAVGWNASNNACKTLKCPKCNWHYKYQETLEIHMKEKHPENETTCIYCITGQQHPRLARGETYTCGYKPYRCEVCNYSTTTKGNLSIHMQSDKHINNMQELQNGGVITAPDGTKITQAALAQMPLAQRLNPTHPFPLQNWRCDLCNYETNIPRNLRIHLTSEKHVQNLACMSGNMKQIQSFQFLQNLAGTKPEFPANPLTDLMSELSQNPALFFQFLKNSQQQQQFSPPGGDSLSSDPMEPPPEPADPNPSFLYNCCICREFSTNSIDSLSCHINLDRSTDSDTEVSVVLGGVHLCKLCSYKTNLKANFQLHLKTDKHLARLSLLNHIQEGGPGNEWKLKFLLGTNPVQLRCNSCDFYTNSMHKLQVHTQSQAHEVRFTRVY